MTQPTWATETWADSLTGTTVRRLSPKMSSHFRGNYFRHRMVTADGQWVVFSEFARLEQGRDLGPKRLWARDLSTDELRDLGPIPDATPWGDWAVAATGHDVVVLDPTDPDRVALLVIDIDSGERRRVQPSVDLPHIYEATTSADGRCVYTPWWRDAWPKRAELSADDWRAMVAARPGRQHMMRIDLTTGEAVSVFEADTWWIGHPNPSPVDLDVLMCCQEAYGTNARFGEPVEFERVRLFDLGTSTWMSTHRRDGVQGAHEHWSSSGRRIYGHGWAHGVHLVMRIDLDAGAYEWFATPPGSAESDHLHIAPDETFLVGDGRALDRSLADDDLRRRLEELIDAGVVDSLFGAGPLDFPNGGEVIWRYDLPSSPTWPAGSVPADPAEFARAIADRSASLVQAAPVCRFRSLLRGPMLGHRLESNAHVTPDGSTVVFQSSGPDDRFEVWAAELRPRPRA